MTGTKWHSDSAGSRLGGWWESVGSTFGENNTQKHLDLRKVVGLVFLVGGFNPSEKY